MADNLLNSLKMYGEDANRRAPSILLDEISDRGGEMGAGVETAHTHVPATRRKGWAIAVAAAGVAIVVIATVPILFGGAEPDVSAPSINIASAVPPTTSIAVVPTDDAAPSTTVSTPTTLTPPPEVQALSDGWSLAYIAEHSGTVWAALETAEGQLLLAGMGPHLAVSSDNGATWEEADPSGTVRSQAGFLSGGAATNGDVTVVAGRTCEMQGDARQYAGEPYEPFPCPQEPGLWATSDLENWTRVDLSESTFPTCVGVSGECYSGIEYLIGTDSGLLATGTFTTDSDPGECTDYSVEQLVLTSGDGISWTGQEPPEPSTLGLHEWQAAWDDPDCHVDRTLVPLGHADGRWLTMLSFSTGFETEPEDLDLDGSVIEWSDDWGQYRTEWQQLVWFDEQQARWTHVETDLAPIGRVVAAQMSGSDQMVLGGSTSWDCETVGAAIWYTTESAGFEAASFIGGAPAGCVVSISASEIGYAAIAGDSQEGQSFWYSTDARQWHRVEVSDEIHEPYLVSLSDVVMVAGWTEIEVLADTRVDENGNDVVIWMTQPASAVWVWQGP
jgi:hypothetical protein